MSTGTLVRLGSLALTVLVWQRMLGSLELALGMLIIIFIHEMGHFLAARQLSIPVSLPIFTPIGALIAMPSLPANAKQEAYVALAGPVLGTVGSVTTLALGAWLGVPQLISLAGLGFMLNLFNLIPLAPMDGGRISMTISRHLWVVGAALLAYVVVSSGFSNMTMLVALFVAWQAYGDIIQRRKLAQEKPEYFQLSSGARTGTIAVYLALAAFLTWAYFQPSGLLALMSMLGI